MKSLYSPESERLRAWLKTQRELSGMTMRQLAARLNKPHSFIGKVETGQRRLDVIELVWYCRQLGTNPHNAIDVITTHSNTSDAIAQHSNSGGKVSLAV